MAHDGSEHHEEASGLKLVSNSTVIFLLLFFAGEYPETVCLTQRAALDNMLHAMMGTSGGHLVSSSGTSLRGASGNRQRVSAAGRGRARLSTSARAATKGTEGREGDAASMSCPGSRSKALGFALACLITVQHGLAASEAFAGDANEANLSSYERRKLENERRKEMLRSLREKAEKGAASVDSTAPVPPPQAAYTSPKPTVPTIPRDTPKVAPPSAPKDDGIKPPSFSAPKVDMPKLPSFGGAAPSMPAMPSFSVPKLPSLGGDDSNTAASTPSAPPKPAVPPPRPAAPAQKPLPPPPPPPPPPSFRPATRPVVPAPAPDPTPKFTRPNVAMPDATPKGSEDDTLDQWRKQQKKDLAERQKREAKAAKKSMRGATLPPWLAEFFLLALFGGVGFTIYGLGDTVSAIYRKADRFLLGLFAPKK